MRRLGELEAAIMEVLWSTSGPAAVREVLEALHRDPEPAYATVMTVLDNLHRKGNVTRERAVRAWVWVYRPSRSREEFEADAMASVPQPTAARRCCDSSARSVRSRSADPTARTHEFH
jgi:predicted transcriptional regulator